MASRIFPIGIQSFEKLRERENVIYVDKTALVYRMAHEGTTYFLSRPRRFGKSLLVSTLEAYFQARKDLFKGLAIEKLEKEWKEYPVLRFDLSGAKFAEIENLNSLLNRLLSNYEQIYEGQVGTDVFSTRLANLIVAAKKKTGLPVVVLVDEYDAPMLDSLNDKDRLIQIRNIMRDFYSPLKSSDNDLKFIFLTGISKFSQLSVFSELNNLDNISLNDAYGSICGITETELREVLKPEVESLAAELEISFKDACAKLKQKYDGYHFCRKSDDIYNPFSLLNALKNKSLDNYWFSTGTPTYLTEQIKRYNIDPKTFETGMPATVDMFDTPTETATSPIPVLYQSGYLTIKSYNPQRGVYTLAYPNEEVRIGFLKCMMPFYVNPISDANSSFLIRFTEALHQKDIEGALTLMRAFMSSIPYDGAHQDERHYSMIFYLIFSLSTQFSVRTEVRSAAGRADAVVETDDTVYVFEFKLDGSVDEALAQIDSKGYLIPYSANGKELVKVGVNFDQNLRTIGEWKIG
ncbi:MAG TPA: ATP-binding protein [Paludibacteraceae bacterium]|nr:ATP-binding protein [Paludibacteraceae bacterium]HOU68586.1 ATP-binding protein [Paludibacteraceae bacterium]HPH63787.1 ATP-binding protein [Paludibacteraceae bacterium]HQF50422.1 ATP-binding protein [Paludibacteraceae bacterium]